MYRFPTKRRERERERERVGGKIHLVIRRGPAFRISRRSLARSSPSTPFCARPITYALAVDAGHGPFCSAVRESRQPIIFFSSSPYIYILHYWLCGYTGL